MKTLFQMALAHLDVETAKQVASKVFNECGLETCQKLSLGFVCSSCSRFACNSHVYFKLGKPPIPVCAACVVDSHPELLEE